MYVCVYIYTYFRYRFMGKKKTAKMYLYSERIFSLSRNSEFCRAFLGTWNKITSPSNFIAALSHGRVIYRSLYFCWLVAANNSVWPTARRGAGRNSAPSCENVRPQPNTIIWKRSQLPEALLLFLSISLWNWIYFFFPIIKTMCT